MEATPWRLGLSSTYKAQSGDEQHREAQGEEGERLRGEEKGE